MGTKELWGKQGNIGGGKVAVMLALLTLTGCAGLKSIAGIQQNPLVVGTINIAAAAQCEQFAKDEPESAKQTAQYLGTLSGATAACIAGINSGLAN